MQVWKEKAAEDVADLLACVKWAGAASGAPTKEETTATRNADPPRTPDSRPGGHARCLR
jgi:hypothetical protein